jgi:hypothetical protein
MKLLHEYVSKSRLTYESKALHSYRAQKTLGLVALILILSFLAVNARRRSRVILIGSLIASETDGCTRARGVCAIAARDAL